MVDDPDEDISVTCLGPLGLNFLYLSTKMVSFDSFALDPLLCSERYSYRAADCPSAWMTMNTLI